jgi:thiaminase (transcriptional activator TenA)
MVPVPFSDELRDASADIWDAAQTHPFLTGIGDGTLPPDRFRFYVRQDYLFLIDYGRLLALGCARAPRLELMERFADLTHSTLLTEMELHRGYAAEWGISREELERERPQPATRAYTDYLLRTAALGDYAELVAVLLPCMWGYSEAGQRLSRTSRPSDARYAQWIEMYAGAEFAALAGWCREVCDEVALAAGPQTRDRMQAAFLTSSRHELAFWDAAWTALDEPGANDRSP